MKKIISRTLFFGIAAMLAVSFVDGQNRSVGTSGTGDKYVISAKAGGVNYVEGNVVVIRANGRSGLVLKRDELTVGDHISTGLNSRAEILLNPGSYMRIGPETTFEFVSTDLEKLQIRIEKGSAIFEVYASDDFEVAVTTPKAKVTLFETGIFRVDARNDGSVKVASWEGKAEISGSNATVVKEGKEATVVDGRTMVTGFDQGDKDALETWSKTRGKALAKNTSQLKNDSMRSALMSSYDRRAWNMYDSFGLWVFDASFGAYSFLPFGIGWYSPYGYGFGCNLGYYNLPGYIYIPPIRIPQGPPLSVLQGTKDRTKKPPFEAIEQTGGVKTYNPIRNIKNDPDPIFLPAPVYIPAPTVKNPNGKKPQ